MPSWYGNMMMGMQTHLVTGSVTKREILLLKLTILIMLNILNAIYFIKKKIPLHMPIFVIIYHTFSISGSFEYPQPLKLFGPLKVTLLAVSL